MSEYIASDTETEILATLRPQRYKVSDKTLCKGRALRRIDVLLVTPTATPGNHCEPDTA